MNIISIHGYMCWIRSGLVIENVPELFQLDNRFKVSGSPLKTRFVMHTESDSIVRTPNLNHRCKWLVDIHYGELILIKFLSYQHSIQYQVIPPFTIPPAAVRM